MHLTLKPVDVPFKVGDTVWVDQPFGATHEFPYFQGIIMQIILDGSLANTLLIRQPKETHELVITSAVYGLKPMGEHTGEARVNVTVQLLPHRTSLFATKEELMDYQNQLHNE
ncbi:hypothetical protein [Spirosoma endophyticum]|uniref:Uncharacterized protein n=1 Tax=Spirosoma endophyticum TaxID=662367 RepID=A0A1I2HTI5_9BACT|nr:hypothetical protein [Spirosoma endophyticum]SFF32948.1 hypothetical protein SAMN05216167_14820 [Spirosoma endophyticum]